MEIKIKINELFYYSYDKKLILCLLDYVNKENYKVFKLYDNKLVNIDVDELYRLDYCYKSTLYESNFIFFDFADIKENEGFNCNNNVIIFDLNDLKISYFYLQNLESPLCGLEIFSSKEKAFIQIKFKENKDSYYYITQIYDLKTNTLLEKIDIDYEILAIHPNQDIIVYSNHILRMPPSSYDLYKRNIFSYSIKEKKVISEIDYPQDYSLISAKFTPNGRYFVLNTYDSYDFEKYTPILARIYDFEKNIFLYNLCEKLYLEYTIDYDLKHMFFSNNSKYGIFYLEPAIVLVFEIELGKIIVVKEEVFEMIYDSESDMILYTMDDYKKNEKTFIIESLEEFIEKNRTIKKSFLIDSDE